MLRPRNAGSVLRVSSAVAVLTVALAGRAQAQVPAPWTARDIGSPTPAGSSSYDQATGIFAIDAGGADIWGTSDKFHFIYQPIAGDVDITARVDSITRADQWSKVGVMIRASLAANSAHAFALVSAGKGVALQRRTATGGITTHTSAGLLTPPRWVRLVRAGTQVTASVSSNGTTWTTIASDTIALGATAYVGIAATSHNSTMVTSADVSNVKVTKRGLPAPLTAADIGAPAIAGSTSYSNGTFTITAGGRDIWDTADEFHFVYQPVTGDVDVKARVNSLTNSDPWARTGVMIREALNANSKNAASMLTVANGSWLTRRVATGGVSTSTKGNANVAPEWVRLKRNGNLFTAYASTDGLNWTVLSSDTITMASTVYVGIAATSHNTAVSMRTVVDNLSITQAQRNQPPAVTLTAPANGSTFTAPGTMTLSATASDPEGQLSKVEFYNGTTLLGTDTTSPYSFTWSSVPAGTYSLTAVAYDAAGAKTTSNAASVTVGSPNQPPTVSLTSPANGASFTAPASITIAASASDPEGQLSKVEFYAGTILLGTDTAAPFTFAWPSVGAGTYSLTAVAYDAAGAKTTSAAVTVTVNGVVTTPPRAVSFTASVDHNTSVTSYRLDVFAGTANPATATPVASVNLGKPTPDASGVITSDQQAFFTALAAGNYVATVSSLGAAGSSRSASVAFTR